MKSAGLYHELAAWWPLISPLEDYTADAKAIIELTRRYSRIPIRNVLDLGCGGGHLAYYLKQHWQMTLTDLSRDMLKASRELNPECEHLPGDMRTFRLKRQFDAIVMHDAVMYLTSRRDLARALRTATVHCRPGGVVIAFPECTTETFVPMSGYGGTDNGKRGARFLEWRHSPDSSGTTFMCEYVFMLRNEHGNVRTFRDQHVLGMFPRSIWLEKMRAVGLTARSVRVDSSDEDNRTTAIVGVKPLWSQ